MALPDLGRSTWGILGFASEAWGNSSELSVSDFVDLSVGSGFCGEHNVTSGAANAIVTGVTGVVDLAAGFAGRGADVEAATSLVMGASGLMASG